MLDGSPFAALEIDHEEKDIQEVAREEGREALWPLRQARPQHPDLWSGPLMAKVYDGQKGRKDLRYVAADALVVTTDKQHCLYDERAALAPSEEMVLSVAAQGVIEPIIANPDGDKLVVVDGRQRRNAMLEAVRRGLVPAADALVPVVIREGSESELFEALIATNEIRRADLPSVRADKMQRFRAFGADDARIARAFGCSASTVRNTLKIGGAIADVRRAVDAGTLSIANGATLADKPREEQKALLSKMIEAGVTKGRAASEAVRGGKATKAKAMLSRKVLERLIEALPAECATANVLALVLGDEDAVLTLPAYVATALEKAREKRKPGRRPKVARQKEAA